MRDPDDDALAAWLNGVATRVPAATAGPRLVRYGGHEDQVADLWLPPGEPLAVVVSLHGGYFRPEYRRDLNAPLSRELCRRGLAVCNVEYRRIGTGGGLEETTADVWAALDAMAGVVGERGRRVAVLGHSAGGFLACLAAPHRCVDLVVSMGGIGDLRAAALGGWDGGAVARWLGARPEEDPDRYDVADLRRRWPTGTRLLLVHGSRDGTVPVTQSRALAAALGAAGHDVELLELVDEGHFAFLDPREPAACVVIERLLEWSRARVEGHPLAGPGGAAGA